MKLDKKSETEILEIYNSYWENYLKGDVEAMHPLLADEFTQVGSAESEVFSNKKDAVQFLYDTIDQVAGNLEMRNRKTVLEQQENAILIHEFCDLYALADDAWIFYSKFRASTLMHSKKGEWKFTHQHSSFPDSKAEDGQNIAINKIAEENNLLREAVKRRTIELEHKNRELEIEAALEKVRSRTMAMQGSSELIETAELLFDQLRLLGAESLGVAFAICEPENVIVKKWTSIGVFSVPYTAEAGEQQMYEAWKNQKEIYEEVYEGEKIRKYYDMFMGIPEFREGFHKMSGGILEFPVWQKNHAVPFGHGYLLCITTKPFAETNIFIRFAHVFDQTYTRFLDLQKAESQAREAQIEAALEKIRSRSLAMHHSGELKDVMGVMFKKLTELEILIGTVGIQLFDEKTKNCDFWLQNQHQEPGLMKLPYNEKMMKDNYMGNYWDAKVKGESFFNKKESIEQKNRHFEYVFANNPEIPQPLQEYLLQAQHHTQTFIIEKNSALLVDSWDERNYSEEQIEVLKRVSKVFEQAYIRFLDLQKAEAQTREAQINLAVERVRARALAMFKSEEILELVFKLKQEMMLLDIPSLVAATIHIKEKEGNCTMWDLTELEQIEGKIHQPMIIDYSLEELDPELFIKRMWDTTTHYSLIIQNEEDLYRTLKFLRNHGKTKEADESEAYIKNTNTKHAYHPTVVLNNGRMCIDLLESPSDDVEMILTKMGAAFDLAYKRFEDLKNSEAQLREAQIEAALEKIRSRSLAMHHSEELKEVMAVMFDKLTDLNVLLGTIAVQIFDEKTKSCEFWLGNPHQAPALVKLPYDEKMMNDDNYVKDCWEAKAKEESFFNKIQSFDQKNRYFDYVFANNDETVVPTPVRQFIMEAKIHSQSLIIEKKSSLFFDSWDERVYSDESIEVLKRLAKVFEQAYVRFLDLKKAEAQAKEAQIEVALERVRSKTMAMQHSNQLKEIAGTTLEQLQSLGFIYGACSIVIMDEKSGDMTWWISGFENEYPTSYGNTYFEHPFYLTQLNNWKQGKKYAVMECEGASKKSYDEYVFSKTDFVNIPEELKNIMQSFEKITFSNAYMQHGALSWSTDPLSDDHALILQRFAAVFEQSYTRFLDLQKAEAQAREAQIEGALERVRSRTMAMRHSSELSETATVMYGQLKQLGAELWTCGFALCETNNIMVDKWMGSPITGHEFNRFVIPHTANEGEQNMYDTWKNGADIFTYVQEGEELKGIYEHLMTVPSFRENYKDIIASGVAFPTWQKFYIATYKYGYLMTITTKPFDEEQVFIRFANVFEQTYTRFLDLQKAEAQAREAQIEVALERIRSRAMAMNTSEELSTLIGFIYTEYTKLNMQLDRGFIMTFDPDTKDAHWWMVSATAPDKPLKILVKYHEYAPNLAILKGWECRDQRWSYVLEGNNKKTWDDYQFANALSQLPDIVKENMRSVKSVILNASFQNFGCIMLSSFEPLSDDHFDLLIRLSKVFELTYIRFLDLQLKEQNALKLTEEKLKLELTLSELRATQTQLIQTEKLASLGELTAGIAHEIQNPLNFVNNFSEVSVELANELQEALRQRGIEANSAEGELVSDLIQNQEKIHHHGKRASSIVKGMLEHSRTSIGEKELIDINALVDEYLRLAYHGLRAKDKTFNADFKTAFDPNLPKIGVIPQDFGRVLLNLINNAFYATKSVQKPLVVIKTEKVENGVKISIKDNGTGMSEDIKAKIFQPFFTTKPTGEGTGLGLSLAYDIVVKGHGGSIEVESEEGVGTTFVVYI